MENTLKALLKLRRPEHDNPMRLHREHYEVVAYNYALNKDCDKKGNITSGLQGGTINVQLSTEPTDELMAWVFDTRMFINGEITLFDNFNGGNENKITFEDARCVGFKLHYNMENSVNMITDLTINTPKMIIGSTHIIIK